MHLKAFLKISRRKHQSAYHLRLLSFAAFFDELMRDLRLLFNAARDKYNDEDTSKILIAHYPFRKYKIAEAPAPVKRNLTIDQIIAIRDFQINLMAE